MIVNLEGGWKKGGWRVEEGRVEEGMKEPVREEWGGGRGKRDNSMEGRVREGIPWYQLH